MSIKNELTRIKAAKASIAQAIENKGVSVPADSLIGEYASMIEKIETGTLSVERKDINFYDYDGTIVASYTIDEFASVTELPTPPEHEQILFQRWNWTLDSIKAFGRAVDVGANYTTKSGKSEFDLTLTAVTGLDISVRIFNDIAGNAITIEWGDGTSDVSGTTARGIKTFTHTYAANGNYTMTVDSQGGYYPYGDTTPLRNMFSKTPSHICTAVRLGARCIRIAEDAFYNCFNLTNITIPDSVTIIGAHAFYSCTTLRSATIPDGVTNITTYMFYACYSLKSATMPNSVTNLENIVFPSCQAMDGITIPDGVPRIGSSTINNSYNLTSVTIPASVTSIGTNAFANCYSIKKYKLLPEIPPTLDGITAFTNISGTCIIEVPKGSLEAYKNATNWSAYADYMKEAE